jgi:hypothetical protein
MQAALQHLHRRLDHLVVHADGAGGQRHVLQAQGLDQVGAQRAHGLHAQALDAARRVVAGQRSQVDQADGLDQPRGLEFLLDRAAVRQTGRAAVGRALVDVDMVDPAQVQWDRFVALEVGDDGHNRFLPWESGFTPR